MKPDKPMREKKYSVCTLDCPDSCSVILSTGEDGTVTLAGNPDHPFTRGFTCRKSKYYIERLNSPLRITHPLLRRGNDWVRISWQEALALCAEKIQLYRSEPLSILYFHGEGAKGILKQTGKLFFSLLGTTQVRGSLCDAAGYVACAMDFGSRENHDLSDLLNARRMVNWGRDLGKSSVHAAAVIRKARKQGLRVLTLSPGGDGNAEYNDDFITIRPGMDRFLAAAAVRLLWERGGVADSVLERTFGAERFRELVFSHSVPVLLERCGVQAEDLEQLLRYYQGQGPTATFVGTGLQRYTYGGENVRFINALAMLTGNVGLSGGGVYYHMHSLRSLNVNWLRDPEKKPGRTLLMPTIGRDILQAADPPIRMIWVDGSNVVNQAPDCGEIARAFETIEFKVVVDAFMTDTAMRADLILPCALLFEQEDVAGSYMHSYVQYVAKALEPPGEARTDHWIQTELGRLLSPPVELPDAEACFRKALDTPFIDITLEELREKGFTEARRPSVAYEGMHFEHADGRYRFPNALHDEPPAPEGFPYRLLTLIRGDAIHSQILEDRQAMPPTVWVSPRHGSLKHLDLEKEVYLVSPLGRMRVKVALQEGLHPDVVLYRRGDWMKLGGGANRLIKSGLTDVGRGAPFYHQFVRLENNPGEGKRHSTMAETVTMVEYGEH